MAQDIFSKWLPISEAIFSSVIDHVPVPVSSKKYSFLLNYSGVNNEGYSGMISEAFLLYDSYEFSSYKTILFSYEIISF